MSFMDDTKSKLGDTSDMKARFEELKSKEDSGDLDDKRKQELQQMREKFENKKAMSKLPKVSQPKIKA